MSREKEDDNDVTEKQEISCNNIQEIKGDKAVEGQSNLIEDGDLETQDDKKNKDEGNEEIDLKPF